MLRHSKFGAFVTWMLVLLACSDFSATNVQPAASWDAVLTPYVESLLTPDGRFAPVPDTARPGEISARAAVELAKAHVKSAGSYLMPHLVASYGGPIDLGVLTPDTPVKPAVPYEPLPVSVPAHVRRAYGEYYQVPFVGRDGVPVLVVAVSVYNTDAKVEGGELMLPRVRGNNMFVSAITPRISSAPNPERAASIAHRITGARVASVPRPVHPGRPYAPTAVYWEVELDRPVEIVMGANRAFTSRVFITQTGELMVAELDGRSVTVARYRVKSRRGSTPVIAEASVRYKPGAVRYARASANVER